MLTMTSEFIPLAMESGAGATWGESVWQSGLHSAPVHCAATHDVGVCQ